MSPDLEATLPSVQATVEAALLAFLREDCAGCPPDLARWTTRAVARTDKGTHARAQVCHFRLPDGLRPRVTPAALREGLDRRLRQAGSVRVWACTQQARAATPVRVLRKRCVSRR